MNTRTTSRTGSRLTVAAFALAFVAAVLFGLALSPLDDVEVPPAFTGYASQPMASDRAGNITVDVLDANDNVIVDDQGQPVRIKVSPFALPLSRQVTVYEGTGNGAARYGTDSFYSPNATILAAIATLIAGFGCVIGAYRYIAYRYT